ncbi:MAG TPA: response regulator [Gemmatimonadaceae bacterium]|jgi:two-component system cell cycle sensor histidine kinase/response regulator CckA|nr:response regulator [Gemmatimonadaceae bacterium]
MSIPLVAPTPTRIALVVDDERVVRTVMRRLLERRGWDVIESETAEQALEVLSEPSTRIDVVLCDLNLPGLSGSALCSRIVTMRPELATRLILTSGDPRAAAAELARESLRCPVLEKPFSLTDLERVVAGISLVA